MEDLVAGHHGHAVLLAVMGQKPEFGPVTPLDPSMEDAPAREHVGTRGYVLGHPAQVCHIHHIGYL